MSYTSGSGCSYSGGCSPSTSASSHSSSIPLYFSGMSTPSASYGSSKSFTPTYTSGGNPLEKMAASYTPKILPSERKRMNFLNSIGGGYSGNFKNTGKYFAGVNDYLNPFYIYTSNQ